MDNMDELIREASKSYHPAYDDKSWVKMEALLDKHLPVKKDRRRPVVFFLLSLLITGGAFFAIFHLSTVNKKGIPVESQQASVPLQHKSPKVPASTAASTLSPAVTNDKDAKYLPGNTNNSVPQNSGKSPAIKHAKIGNNSFRGNAGNSSNLTVSVIPPVDQQAANNGTLPGAQLAADTNDDLSLAASPGVKDPQPINSGNKLSGRDSAAKKEDAAPAKPDAAKALASTQPKSTAAPKPSVKNGFGNNFTVNLSAGPDLSFVGLNNQSNSRLSYGAGLGYTFAGRLTLRTGFFVTKKTYSAKGYDYHPPSWYWTYNSSLNRVYADCDIYEIPLSASYNFKQSNGHNWFAGVGFSTFLMKKETYDYYYKDAWGQAMNKSWTLRNGGNQYFSVLTISGGYQYKISSRVAISAEPYFKLPLQEIGFGKIKLNSGGLLFTASIKPFARGN